MSSFLSELRLRRLAFGALAAGLAVLAPLSVADVAAQATGTVTGVVTSSTGATIAGAQVSIPGTGLGALTNNVGRYVLLNVPAGETTVRAEFIGYGSQDQTVSVSAGGSVVVDFTLRSEAISLEGVVVTGTAGQARRKEVGNSIAQINTAQVENEPIQDVADLLQGRATGVQIFDNSGQAGAGATIRLRGNNSVSQGNSPLIYVDGIRIRNTSFASYGDEANQNPSPLGSINPDDVERVEVIKGAAATTLYGTEAAGGVIQIFTKRGAAGAPAWSMTIDQGINNMGHVGPDSDVNPTGLWVNDCTEFPGCPSDGDWLETGHVQRYSLSVRGGTEQTNYFLSGSWGDERGVLQATSDGGKQGTQDWSMRGNFGFSPSESLNIRFNNAFSHKNIDWTPDGNNAEGLMLNVMRGPRDYTPDHDDSFIFDMGVNSLVDHFTTGMNVTFQPTTSMSHRLNAGLDWSQHDYTEERPWGFFYVPLGDREVDNAITRKLTLDYSGTWTTDIGSVSSSTSWGGQLYDDFLNRQNGFGQDFAGPGDKDLDSGAITEAFETRTSVTNGGFFFQQQFGIWDQLFVTAGIRVDGHSAFGEDFGWAPYPKFSAAYTVSDNEWYPENWGALKVRAAYGESGKAPGTFDALRTWDAVAGDEGQPAVTPSNLGNPDLGPERTRELEFGFEGSTWDGRVTFEYTYYDQRTSDALIEVQQTPSGGFTGTQLENVGIVDNKGHEAFVNVNVLQADNLIWDIGGRYSTNESNVVTLGGLESIGLGWRNFVRPGQPLPVFCHTRVQNPNEVGVAPVMEEECLGTVYPTHTYGINTSLTFFNRLTLDALGEGQGGHWLSSGVAYQNVRRGVWPLCDDVLPIIDSGDTSSLTAEQLALCDVRYVSYGMWTQPADFFKLRSIAMSYRIPDEWLPSTIRGATLRLQGRNLFTSTDFDGLDPEAFEDGSGENLFRQEYYNLPPYRTFLLSVKVDF